MFASDFQLSREEFDRGSKISFDFVNQGSEVCQDFSTFFEKSIAVFMSDSGHAAATVVRQHRRLQEESEVHDEEDQVSKISDSPDRGVE